MKTKFIVIILLFSLFNLYYSSAQVPNSGFENWTTDIDGNLNPDFWSVMNNTPDFTTAFQYTPAYSGNFSMRVTTYNPGFGEQPGIAFVEFPYTCRPTQIHVCVNATVMSGDIGFVMMALSQGDSAVAAMDSCTFKFYVSTNGFECFDFPVSYISDLVPDTATIMVIAGNFGGAQLGTEVIVDDISFDCNVVDIEEAGATSPASIGKNYPNPSSGYTFIPITLNNGSDLSIAIMDMLGKEIKTVSKGFMPAGEHLVKLDINDLSGGIYFYTLSGNGFQLPGKFVIRN